MGILVKNGEIITAAERFVGDVYCADGKIVAVGPGLEKQQSSDTVIDASGQIVLPGGIDAHVHMELPFMGTESSDDFETGTAAGVAGGRRRSSTSSSPTATSPSSTAWPSGRRRPRRLSPTTPFTWPSPGSATTPSPR